MTTDARGRLVLVGEANPYGGDPRCALYDDPPGCAGARLRRILGLRRKTYLDLGRVNLCPRDWSTPLARDSASRLRGEEWDVLVLLGNRVRGAFGLRDLAPFEVSASGSYVSLPHPSGRNLAWNDPRAAERARELLRGAAPWVPWGEVVP